jgi:hypothetical protein
MQLLVHPHNTFYRGGEEGKLHVSKERLLLYKLIAMRRIYTMA